MNTKARIAMICAALICVAAALWIAGASRRSLPTLTYSQFVARVRAGQIASVVVMRSSSQAICRLKDGQTVRTVLPSDYRDAMLVMLDKMVDVEIRDSAAGWPALLSNATPFLLFLALWIFLMIRKFPNGSTLPCHSI
jgi:ATP-dependent Zn protease